MRFLIVCLFLALLVALSTALPYGYFGGYYDENRDGLDDRFDYNRDGVPDGYFGFRNFYGPFNGYRYFY